MCIRDRLVDHHEEEEVEPVPPDPEPEWLEDSLVLVVVEHGVDGQGERDYGDGHRAHDPELAEAGQHQARDPEEDVGGVEERDGNVKPGEELGQPVLLAPGWHGAQALAHPSGPARSLPAKTVKVSGTLVNPTARGSK